MRTFWAFALLAVLVGCSTTSAYSSRFSNEGGIDREDLLERKVSRALNILDALQHDEALYADWPELTRREVLAPTTCPDAARETALSWLSYADEPIPILIMHKEKVTLLEGGVFKPYEPVHPEEVVERVDPIEGLPVRSTRYGSGVAIPARYLEGRTLEAVRSVFVQRGYEEAVEGVICDVYCSRAEIDVCTGESVTEYLGPVNRFRRKADSKRIEFYRLGAGMMRGSLIIRTSPRIKPAMPLLKEK